MNYIAGNVRALRLAAGLTQTDLANSLAGWDARLVSKVEHGSRGVKAEELRPLADALGTCPLVIIGPALTLQARP